MTQENSSETNSAPTPPAETKKTTWKKEVVQGAILFFLIVGLRVYIAEPYLVDGRSMDPTFLTGDYLIVDKISYKFKQPDRNSVIVFKYPGDPRKSFIKRVIGLPGEKVVENGNTVKIINAEHPEGFEIDQSYVVHELPANFEKTLADDEYFVMGDNRAESFDSRSWGTLNKKYIIGEPVIRLFTFTESKWYGIPKISVKGAGILPGKDNK